jgi:hypothetical protein
MKFFILALCLSTSSYTQSHNSPIEGRFPDVVTKKTKKDVEKEREQVMKNKKAHDQVRGKKVDPKLGPKD